MKHLFSKAVEKAKKDGIISLIIVGSKWSYNRRKRLRYYLKVKFRMLKYKLKGYSALPEPRKKIRVTPDEVDYYVPTNFRGSYRENYGVIRGGEWDRKKSPLKENPKYQACRKRVEDDLPWSETGVIEYLEKLLTESEKSTVDECSSREELVQLYETQRENLYQSLKSDGYDEYISEVCCRVHIGRDGELIFCSGGRHRFFLSRLLGINEVPVRVLWRHKKWQKVREEVSEASSVTDLDKETKQYLTHPDMLDVLPEKNRTELRKQEETGESTSQL